jgi:DNA polymerase I-like protein with 3'-5' exonuclease and polymerase domains
LRKYLQNLPRDGTSKVKEMFASRFGSAGRIVEVDYTALEVVALAAISGDDNLMAALLNNIDMHCQRLAGVLGEPYDEVYEKCHNKEHPQHKQYKQLRTDIKPRAFAAQYGASAAGISFATGCTIEDAQTFLDAEAKLYPQSISYRQVVRSKVEQNGAKNPPKREIRDDGGFGAYREGHFDLFDGATRYAFRTFEKRVEGQLVQDYKDTQLANYWCQGEASFIVQVACGRVIRWLIANDFFGGCVLPINTVHDAIYLDCVNEEWARYAGKMVQQIMESTPKYMAERMPQYQQYRYHTTPFPAAAEFGPNMMKKESC